MLLGVVLFTRCSEDELLTKEMPDTQEEVFIEVKPPQPLAPEEINKTALLEMVNQVRQSGCNCGAIYMPPVKPVVWNDKLETAAEVQAEDMNANMVLTHRGSDGSNAGDRIKNAGYSFVNYGENLAVGFSTEAKVMNAWIRSETHCRIIMGSRFKEMGASTAGPFWSQVFGTKL